MTTQVVREVLRKNAAVTLCAILQGSTRRYSEGVCRMAHKSIHILTLYSPTAIFTLIAQRKQPSRTCSRPPMAARVECEAHRSIITPTETADED